MKIKYFFFYIFFLVISVKSFGQTIGNEWINYNQKYFRLDISNDNIHRLDYNTINQAFTSIGLTLTQFNPKGFQIFGRGSEVAIYINGEADGSFDPGDFIEFYGRKNDGWFDTRLYANALHQPNPYYSLFNDTASYYLTYTSLLNGKRMSIENGTNFSSYTDAPYILKQVDINFNSNYYLGFLDGYGIGKSEYSEGEGWVGGAFNRGFSLTQNIPSTNAYSAGPATQFEICAQGRSAPIHELKVQVLGQTLDTSYTGYPNLHFTTQGATSLLGSTTTPINIQSIDVNGQDNYQSISYIKMIYPHTLYLENGISYNYTLPIFGALPKVVLKLYSTTIASTAGDNAYVYDLTNNIRIIPIKTGSQFTCLAQNFGASKEMFITSEQKMGAINTLTAVNGTGVFTNFGTEPYLSSDYIIVTHKSLRAQAEEYKTYRQTSGYPVLYTPMIADVDELYDQFAYGIRKNPLAIRNFARYALTNFHQTPKHLFLIGKSYRAGENSSSMPIYRKNSYWYNLTLVPTFGVPPSDNMFTSGLINSSDYSIAIPTGRLSAKVIEHVSLYLNKVRDYENAMRTPQPWMKNILHFAGGTDNLHTTILGWLNDYKSTIEDTLFGGKVKTVEKTTTEPIQINQSDSLKSMINNGVSLMTFFGHAAGVGFDISIDNPDEYNNYGKYPMLIGLSCYAGDLYTSGGNYDRGSSSEQFVLIENKGTIAYLASVSSAIDSYLNMYCDELYREFGQINYGKSIGYNIQQTISNFSSTNFMKETCMDLTYHGDPAIVLNSFAKPDYVIQPADVSFNPTVVTTEFDSLTLKIQLRNIGRAINDSVIIHIKRSFPDNSVEDRFLTVKAPYCIDTINVKYLVNRIKGVGSNQFSITLDAYNQIDELNENNNITNISLSIISSDIIPVYPAKYAVVPSNQITLKASTGSPFHPTVSYTFEIDTTDLYNSPLKRSTTLNSPGGIVQWSLPFALTDSTVYYWHVTKTGDTTWRESSFQYIQGKSGWGQAHFFQFKNNQYQLINYNRNSRKFEFIQDVKSVKAQNLYFGYGMSWTELWYKINGSIMDQWCCVGGGNGFKLAVFNPISGSTWLNPDSTARFTPDLTGAMGQSRCNTYSTYAFDFFSSDTNSRRNLSNFIDSIPNGYYVLAMSLKDNNARFFDESLYHSFESLGSTKIRTLAWNTPYILFGKKGINLANPGDTVVETVGVDQYGYTNLSTEFKTNWDQGSIYSEVVGPALSWGSAHWRIASQEQPSTDSVTLSIIGITATGNEVPLIVGITESTPNILNLSNQIDAHQYPYLKLQLNAKDKVNNTSTQLKSWHVLYEPAPETAIDPVSHYTFYQSPIQEGDSVRFGIATQNIGTANMDSLMVTYRIIKNNLPVWTKTKRLRAHPTADILIDSIAAPTIGLTGTNTIQVEFNPNFDQPEQYHFNNIAEVNFSVSGDKINPLLDVTFDGERIMNGDIISAKPTIQIMLKDENRFLLLNEIADTSKFRISIKGPSDNDYVRIPFYSNGVEVMQFVPATQNNKCNVLYKANFATDGTYQLKVEAMDKSDNLSATNSYTISFEVINKSTITNVMNWPNPFSTSTKFVFTLTGSEIPTYFKIQIMTITGKLVREIDLSELGAIHIGRNITDYSWDGKDQFGDQLANGIYLYRVVTNINGESIEKRDSGASKYFTKEFGKMCLIR
jgi:hypothetical protein